MPFWVAEARGFYEEQGLDVELVAVLNPNQGTPAPVNGSITFVLNGFARENMNLSKC
jgi:ABC-type nitrate/sulfonate/bicarbonate transport system substrate-binding protein